MFPYMKHFHPTRGHNLGVVEVKLKKVSLFKQRVKDSRLVFEVVNSEFIMLGMLFADDV